MVAVQQRQLRKMERAIETDVVKRVRESTKTQGPMAAAFFVAVERREARIKEGK